MTREDLQALVAAVQHTKTELDTVEVKSARGGTPKRLFEALSAFANRPGGGVLLFGLDENNDFTLCGVGDAHKLQEELTHVASADMEPALRPEFTLDEIDGLTVLSAEIAEVAIERKPCFYKTAGLNGGSYIRVGNTNRQMTDYEVFGYISSRGQPHDDDGEVAAATIDDLDARVLDNYLTELRRTRPKLQFLNDPRDEVLKRLNIAKPVQATLRPTLAGLLTFGKYPQEFFPQLVITFVQYYGIAETEPTPGGDRFLDNRKFEGPLPSLAEEAVNYILASVRKSSVIRAVTRQEMPEYPLEAVREAILNALVHRDYSTYVRGSQIQVKLFADRLEVISPGGLYGNVTEENLEDEQSTRNAVLMRLMEDLHLVENRGSGINAMIEAMRTAHLEPPRFDDKRSSFRVTFRNHSLLDGESTAWVSQFASLPLNDRQRLALIYLRHNERMANDDYRRLNRIGGATAYKELRELLQAGLIEQQSARRWAYYTLKVPKEAPAVTAPSEEDRILEAVRRTGAITNSACQTLLGVNDERARYLLKKIVAVGKLQTTGEGRWRKYVLPK